MCCCSNGMDATARPSICWLVGADRLATVLSNLSSAQDLHIGERATTTKRRVRCNSWSAPKWRHIIVLHLLIIDIQNHTCVICEIHLIRVMHFITLDESVTTIFVYQMVKSCDNLVNHTSSLSRANKRTNERSHWRVLGMNIINVGIARSSKI